ncbi:uncharacterized protein isoform X3 [Musca autumnalis]|uniref:uncharacterized protein isoform X3 n=1 Tax=Musca autumnalis TaxID=221902 RepID=UPI003CF83858
MSENVSIKTEPFAKYYYEQEDPNNDTNTLCYNTTKLEHFTNMGNDIKEEELYLDKMEEFSPENIDKYTIDVIKKEEVDEVDEFLPDDSPSCHPPSLLTWKSDDCMEVTQQQQHHTNAITQQISLPKLEIIDMHTDENDRSGPPPITGDKDASSISDNKERFVISSSLVAQTPTKHKCEICGNSYTESKNLRAHIRRKHPSSIDTEYVCEICNQRLTTQKGLDLHSYWAHQKPNSTQTPAKHNCEICATTKYFAVKLFSSIENENIPRKNVGSFFHKN